MSTTAVMPFPFFVQTPVFSSPLRALVSRRYNSKHHHGTGILFEEFNPTGSRPSDLIGLYQKHMKPHPAEHTTSPLACKPWFSPGVGNAIVSFRGVLMKVPCHTKQLSLALSALAKTGLMVARVQRSASTSNTS